MRRPRPATVSPSTIVSSTTCCSFRWRLTTLAARARVVQLCAHTLPEPVQVPVTRSRASVPSVQGPAEPERPAPSVQQSGAPAPTAHGGFLLSPSSSSCSLAPARLTSCPAHLASCLARLASCLARLASCLARLASRPTHHALLTRVGHSL